jgi:hypothetical protein
MAVELLELSIICYEQKLTKFVYTLKVSGGKVCLEAPLWCTENLGCNVLSEREHL